MDHPFISICIPTYQRAVLLKKLLDSILVQDFRNYEVLVNDNSPDDSVHDLIRTYTDKLNISYEKNDPAVSATENCNRVIRRARATWIKVMHDDDWFEGASALQQFARAAESCGKDFIFCASNQVYLETNKKTKEKLSEERKKILDDSVFSLFYLNVIGHPSVVMHKKDAYIEYDNGFHWVLDIDFYTRYMNAHPGYHYIPDTLVNIGKGPGQESGKYYKNPLVEIPEYFKLLAKYDPELHLKDKYVFHLVWNMCRRYHIEQVNQIHALGYDGRMPEKLQEIIDCQKHIPELILKQRPWSELLMKWCFKRLSQGLNR